MSKTLIAVDPGASGAIATLQHGKVEVFNMPETRGDTIKLIKTILNESTDAEAYMEKINGWIPDGGASQMFEFGKSVERIGCILETLDVRIVETAPKDWQKKLNLGGIGKLKVPQPPKGLDRKAKAEWKEAHADEIKEIKAKNAALSRDWKNKLKAEAQRRFPNCNVTLKTADALLILETARLGLT